MKTKHLMLLLLLSATSVTMKAQTPPPPDGIPLNPPGDPRPKSLTEVKAYYTSDTLTVSITGYYGDMEVTVMDAASSTLMGAQTEYVFGQGMITLDIHSLASGYYVLYIRLDNDEYTGYFSK